MSPHFHPEFGYFHSLPRFRRDLRVAFAAFASGAALGAVAILAVHVSYSEPESASAVDVLDNVAVTAETPPAAARESPAPQQRNEQRQARPPAAENGAVIARLPLGRSEGVDLASLPARAETSDVSRSIEARQIPQELARDRSDSAQPQQEKRPRSMIGGRDLVHRERSTAAAGPHRPADANYARGRTVFWDWSR